MTESVLMAETQYPVECPPTIVPGAKITFVGEAPGGQEVAWHECHKCGAGAPFSGACRNCGSYRTRSPQGFVGGSGALLRKSTRSAGIDFSACSRSNVCKRRPPGDNFGVFYLDPKKRTQPTQELTWWRHLLLAEVERYRPNILVALGSEALRAVCPDAIGITKWHGSILRSPLLDGLKVIGALHPAYIMRDNWEWYYILNRQLKRAAVEAQDGKHILQTEPADEFVINPTFTQVLEFLEFIRTNHQPWDLDIETVGDTIRCFGLSSYARPRFALCVPIQKAIGPAWTVFEEAQIWRALSTTMRDNDLLENQNLAYDLDYMLDYGCEPGGINFDPMLAMNIAYPEFDKGLDFTTMFYTFYPYYKDEGKTWKKKEPDEKTFTYNCKDMVSTPKASQGIKRDLADSGLTELYRRRVNRLIPVALEMQRNRLRLDRSWHQRLADLLRTERERKQGELNAAVGRDLNVKSTPQVAALLFDELRLPVKKKRGSNSITTDENSLRELRALHPDVRELNAILEIRHLRTKESNYINVEFDVDPDGEYYLGYMAGVSVTKSGRWAFKQSPKWRGSSPQTLPKIMRLMYQPPPGSVFWQRDLSQAEARIVAWLAHCQFLLDTFASPIKIHKFVAGKVWRVDPTTIEADSIRYDIAKRGVHGYNYMMEYKKLATIANVSLDFAKEFYFLYGGLTPELPRWWRSIKETVIAKGRLVTPMGRIRQCYKACSAVAHTGQLPDDILRDLVSYIPQSTVPDVLNEAIYELWNLCEWVKWHQHGHDSYLASGPPERTQEFYERSEEAAARVHFTIDGQDCHIPGEFSWGYSWGAMLAYKVGEDTSYDAWFDRATREGFFKEDKITERLYSMAA